MKYSFTFLTALLLVVGCGQKVSKTAYIDQRLQPMVESFLDEASARDVDLNADLEDLTVRFGRIEGRKGGSCKQNRSPKVITIDSMKWKFIDQIEQESLLYHELAHCLLMRPHNNATLEFGACKSLLREDISKCHLNWGNAQWRSYYLDELFAPHETSDPDWYAAMPEFCETESSLSGKRIELEDSRFQYFDQEDTQAVGDWIINVVARKPETGYTHTELTLNEIMLSISFVQAEAGSARSAPVAHLNVIDALTRTTLVEAISPGEKMNLSLRKHSKAMYIFFDKTLQYVLPVNPTDLKIGCYSTLPQDHYDISFNAVKGGCESP